MSGVKEKKHSITFSIQYNWPPGHISFGGIGPENESLKGKDFKFFVLAREKEDEHYRSFKDEPLSVAEIAKIVTDGSSRGKYLKGDTFVIEVYIGKNKVTSVVVKASEKKPSEAIGPTSVHTNYTFSF